MDTVVDKITQHFQNCPEKTFARGETIITANHAPAGVLYLESGVVEQYDVTPEGNTVVVNIFKAGAFFPMSWAINKTPNRYFFDALTNVTLRIDTPERTITFLQENPDVMFDLLSRVFRGADAILHRLVLATSSASSKRLMFELLIEAQRFGEPVGEHQKRIRVKQTVLAARAGLARETVSRELQQLEKQGLILRYQQGIVVNTAKIEQALAFVSSS